MTASICQNSQTLNKVNFTLIILGGEEIKRFSTVVTRYRRQEHIMRNKKQEMRKGNDTGKNWFSL